LEEIRAHVFFVGRIEIEELHMFHSWVNVKVLKTSQWVTKERKESSHRSTYTNGDLSGNFQGVHVEERVVIFLRENGSRWWHTNQIACQQNNNNNNKIIIWLSYSLTSFSVIPIF
jgi:hypothetical protein